MSDALKPRVYALLVALAEGPRHGYGLKKAVEEESGGAMRVGPATLYRTLDRLAEKGWIEETFDAPVPEEEDDERRRYYRLTRDGLTVLQRETERLARLIQRAQVFAPAPGGDGGGS
ncbi:MAG TPA: helix-turn-helix transcriptional regulator [Longimicrobiales bacterium]|nr:helix-turn-helix transcriptional regulator [Longimicrobiales bacterium]